jgi:hypothetical protein
MATSPIEPSIAQNYNGIHLNYEYNVNTPLWLYDQKWWDTEGGGRKPSVDVIRVYAWLLDKVTSCVAENGVTYGIVLGGRELSHLDIGSTFGISWSGVQRATAYLVKVDLIVRQQNPRTKEHSYCVLHCRKFEVKQVDSVPKELPAGTTVAGTYKGTTYYRKPPLELSSPPVIDLKLTKGVAITEDEDTCSDCGKTCDVNQSDDFCTCLSQPVETTTSFNIAEVDGEELY